MTENQSQQTRKPSEAVDTVRFFKKADARTKLNNKEPKQVISAVQPTKETTNGKAPTPRAKSTPQVKDRSSVPRVQMSPHRIGSDIPIRLDRELLARKECGNKTTLADLTDEILNEGLDFLEKRRNKLADKKSATA